MLKYLVPFTAITSLTILGTIALYKNIDGFLLLSIGVLVAGIGGYNVRKLRG